MESTIQTMNFEPTIKIDPTVRAEAVEPTLELAREKNSHLLELRIQHEQFSKRVEILEWMEEDSALMEQLGLKEVERVRALKQRLVKRLKWIQIARERTEPGFLQSTDVSNF